MWNLSYSVFGERVQLGTRADPGKPKKRKKVQRPISRKARKAFHHCLEPYKVRKRERAAFLLKALDKGAWIDKELIAVRREEFNAIKRDILPLKRAKCYICSHKARFRHHIIPLFRGGSNQASNLVPLCQHCHEQLHPWLKVRNLSTATGIIPVTTSDLEAMGQITPERF